MILKIQFVKSRSPVFDLALALIKKAKTYKEIEEGKAKVYSAEFEYNIEEERHAFEEIFKLSAGWRGMFVYIDGKLSDNYDIWTLFAPVIPQEIIPNKIIDAEIVEPYKLLNSKKNK